MMLSNPTTVFPLLAWAIRMASRMLLRNAGTIAQ
jgi:hypothetical protein